MRGACGRADLIGALAGGDPGMLPVMAGLLGYEALPVTSPTLPVSPPSLLLSELAQPEAAPVAEQQGLADIPFWRLEGHEILEQKETPAAPLEPTGPVEWSGRSPVDPGRFEPLSSWRALLPRLRHAVAVPTEGSLPDIEAIVRRIGEGRILDRLPRRKRLRWGSGLQIIIDRSDRLIPYWRDQDLISAHLWRLFPRHAVEHARYWEGLPEPVLFTSAGLPRAYRLPPPGTLVVMLGDLGCLATGPQALTSAWADFGCRLHDAVSRPVALVPCPVERWARLPQGPWQRLPWERTPRPSRRPDPPVADRTERLLRLVSPAIRIEPGFLRGVRRLLGPLEADAGSEADVWQHPAVIGVSSVAATLDPKQARQLRSAFEEKEPAELRLRVLELLRRWRAELPQEIWFEEIRSLAPASQALLAEASDLDEAWRFLEQVSRELVGCGGVMLSTGIIAWFRRVERRLSDSAWSDPRLRPALHRLWWIAHRADETPATPPPRFDPADVSVGGLLRRLHIWQRGGDVIVADVGEPVSFGSLFGPIVSRNGLIEVGPIGFWKAGVPPLWASDWGIDGFGLWLTFSVEGKDGTRVTHRLRWIRAGRFLMGSPETEPERYGDEGPRHEVTISHGFWLFDTACTQGLWQAVGREPKLL